MKTLAERIKCIRGNDSQGAFADFLGVSRGTVSLYERGEGQPSAEVLLKFYAERAISPTWVLTGQGPMHLGEQPQPAANAPEPPANTPKTTGCARCAKMEAKMEKVEQQRDELVQENRQLLRENGDLKAKCAVLEERQKHCCPEPQVFEKLPNTPPSKTDLRT